jgi:hypothetical protein
MMRGIVVNFAKDHHIHVSGRNHAAKGRGGHKHKGTENCLQSFTTPRQTRK